MLIIQNVIRECISIEIILRKIVSLKIIVRKIVSERAMKLLLVFGERKRPVSVSEEGNIEDNLKAAFEALFGRYYT